MTTQTTNDSTTKPVNFTPDEIKDLRLAHLRAVNLAIADPSGKSVPRLLRSATKVTDALDALDQQLIRSEYGRQQMHGLVSEITTDVCRLRAELADEASFLSTIAQEIGGALGHKLMACSIRIENLVDDRSDQDDEDETVEESTGQLVALRSSDSK